MPYPRTQISFDFPYHVHARAVHREVFPIPLDEVWNIMEDHLYFVHHAYQFEIHSFVLMSNHFHMLVRTPKGNISAGMNWFMRETSKEINRRCGRINQTFGRRYGKTVLGTSSYFLNAYRYVYRNPVRPGLCKRPEEYPYSTLHGLLGQRKLTIPLVEDTLLFSPNLNEETLRWLNEKPSQSEEDEIRKGLRRAVFTLGADRKTRKARALTKAKT